jgi:hypothetical protein
MTRYALPVVLTACVWLLSSMGAAQAAPSHPLPPAGTCKPFKAFDAHDFERSTSIDNRYLPLRPGNQFTLEGRANRGGGPLPHTVIFTVTDVVKELDGVHTLVMWDRDITRGVLVEEELAFFAQDRDGNVWNVGEYPEEFEAGTFAGAPNTWISGQQATAGVHMPAQPELKRPRYLQGFAPTIDFLDCAQVLASHQKICVPASCFDNVLVTDETSPLSDPDAHQQKYHAPGVGIIRVGASDDPEGETLVMTRRVKLDARAMAEARNAALRLDRHGFQVSDIYRRTSPAVPCRPSARGALVDRIEEQLNETSAKGNAVLASTLQRLRDEAAHHADDDHGRGDVCP